jgi:hypothetical protein
MGARKPRRGHQEFFNDFLFSEKRSLKNLDAPHARNAIVETGVFNLSAVCTTDMTVPCGGAVSAGLPV